MYTGEAVNVYDLREKSLSDSELYYFEEWSDVHVKFRNGKLLSGYKGRYDLMIGSLEVLRGKAIVEVPSSLIEEFLIVRLVGDNVPLMDTVRFVRLDELNTGTTKFYEVLVEGDIALLKGVKLERLAPHYVATHDAGNLKPQLVREESYVLIYDDEIEVLSPKRKTSEKIFEERISASEDYFRDNKVNFREEVEIIRLVKYLNSVES